MKKPLLKILGAISLVTVLVVSTLLSACGSAPELEILSDQAVSESSSSLTITWATNRTSTGRVEYGTSTSYGTASPTTVPPHQVVTNLSLAHKITLTGLTAGTKYYYKITSVDAGAVEATATGSATTISLAVSGVYATSSSDTTAAISWVTNLPANSKVDYGTTTAYGTSTTATTALVTEHSVALTGLTAGEEYFYKVTSVDAAANDATATGTFNTLDLNVFSVSTDVDTDTSVTVMWSTDRPATGKVDYGTSTSYGSSTTATTALTLAHSAALTGLTAGTSYYFKVTSVDAADITATATGTFSTTELVISSIAYTADNRSATITWTTDDAATSQVEYGATSAYGSATTATTAKVTAHSVTIADLDPETDYHYQVVSTTTSDSADSADATLTTADIVRIVGGVQTSSGISTLNPFWAQRFPNTQFGGLIMEPLIYNSEGGAPGPALASSWSVDGSTWTVNIDPDAMWSDGEAVTADDVLFTFRQQYLNAGEWSQGRSNQSLMRVAVSETLPAVELEFVHVTLEPDTIVRTVGSFIDDGWEVGEQVVVTGTVFDGADDGTDPDNDSTWLITDVTALVLTLNSLNVLANEGPLSGVTLTAANVAIDALVAVDAKTVTFDLNAAYAESVFLGSLSTVFICPEHIWAPKIVALEAAGNTIEQYALEESVTLADELIGSGPFTFVEYSPLQYVLYETDRDYWGGTAANVDEVMLRMYATAEGATLALKAADVDMLALVEAVAEVPALLLDQNITIDIIPNYNSTIMFFLNMRFPPLHILEVRQAIDMALDKQEIITFAQFGYGTLPQQVPFASGLAESNPDLAWTSTYVDGEGDFLPLADRIIAANILLDAVPGMSAFVEGETRIWTDPDTGAGAFPLSWEGLYLSSPSYQRAAELIAVQMAKIGIEITPQVETGAFGPKVFSGWQVWNYETIIFGYPSDPNFDGMVKQWGQPVFGGNYDGSVVAWNNNPTQAPPYEAGGPPQVYDTPDYGLASPEEKALYLAIYEDLVALSGPINADLRATRFIEDPVARLAAIMEVQQDFADALPIVNLYHPQSMSAFRTDSFEGWGNPEGIFLYGFMPGPTSVWTLMSVSLID